MQHFILLDDAAQYRMYEAASFYAACGQVKACLKLRPFHAACGQGGWPEAAPRRVASAAQPD